MFLRRQTVQCKYNVKSLFSLFLSFEFSFGSAFKLNSPARREKTWVYNITCTHILVTRTIPIDGHRSFKRVFVSYVRYADSVYVRRHTHAHVVPIHYPSVHNAVVTMFVYTFDEFVCQLDDKNNEQFVKKKNDNNNPSQVIVSHAFVMYALNGPYVTCI